MRLPFASVLFVLLVVAVSAGAQQNAIVSRRGNASASAAGGSFSPIISQDGGFVVYLSHANNLVTNDGGNLSLDLFRSPLDGGRTELVSAGTNRSGGANSDCLDFSISRYGLNIAFASRASNLTTNDTNNAVDVFLRYGSGASVVPLQLISADPSGHSPLEPFPFRAQPLSTSPQIAASSDRVVFLSAATNLVEGVEDTNGGYDVFVRDGLGPTRLVSRAVNGRATANAISHSPQISEDGRFVAFISSASDLIVDGPTNSGGDIYVQELDSDGPPIWLSRFSCAVPVGHFPTPLCEGGRPYRCVNYAMSGDGQHVAYIVEAAVPGTAHFVLYASITGTNAARIGEYAFPIKPQISRFGDWVAYSGYGSPIGIAHSNVCLWARASGSNMVVSTTPDGSPGRLWSHSPVMTANGDFVAFVSESALVPEAPSDRFQIYLYERSSRRIELVSVNTNGLPSMGDFEASVLSIAPEGPLAVAFDSTAPDLVTNDLNGASDVFVRVFSPRETRLLSRRHDAMENVTQPTMSASSLQSVSGDGRVIAYTALDDPSIPIDTNRWSNVYVRDMATGQSQLVRANLRGPFASQVEAALQPAISRAGSHIAFAAIGVIQNRTRGEVAPALFWRDLNAETNVPVATLNYGPPFLRFALNDDGTYLAYEAIDQQIWSRTMPQGPTNLISVSYRGGLPNGSSSNVVLSPNGRWAVFQSDATDIVYFEQPPGGSYTPPRGLLYARDLLASTSKVASVTADVIAPVRGRAVFSEDSEWIGYVVTNGQIYVRQIANRFRTNVCASCDQPSLSRDASFVAYQALPTNGPGQIYVKNMRSGVARLISASISGAEGNGPSSAPQITADGRFVVFQSTASDLVENDNNRAADIFVGDRLLGKVLLLSINRSGSGSGNGASSKAVLSADGRTVVFQSLASDLIAGDYNDRRDVFVATLSLPDSDGDGMDDDFEITYFGNLERSGAGDFDGDGHTDKEEFVAGTNPTSDLSILRVISIAAPGGIARQIVWSATPGRTYRVQFKDSLLDDWSGLSGSVRAVASTAAVADDASNPHRFYRVVLED
jgi:Tol biopolymer transport system component